MVSFKRAFLDELELLIQWRRDVRRFETRPVPKQLLLDLLDLAYCAPSVGLSQPWRFVWVRDPGRRQQVIDSFERCNADALEDFDGALAERYASLKLEGLREGVLVQIGLSER